MQKTIIAAAIIGLVSAGASAVTVYDKDGVKFSVGGKFDFAVEHINKGDKQTSQLSDGKYSTSRVTIGAEEALTSDVTAYFGYDLRLDNVFVGKNISSTGADGKVVAGGLTSNDALKGGIVSKKIGRIEAGTINVATQQFVFKKPYVNKSESEIVKYGVSSMGLEALSNRNIYMHSSAELPVAVKASYAFSDANGADTAGMKKAGLLSYGIEGKFGIINGGYSVVIKPEMNVVGQSNELKHSEFFIAAEQKGMKLSVMLSTDNDEAAVGTSTSQSSGRGLGINAYYLIGDKIDLGVAVQRYTDTTDRAGYVKNDGRGYMIGAHYYMSKNTTFFAGKRFDNWDKEGGKMGKIVGNAANFTSTATKGDTSNIFAGMNLAF